MPTRIALIIALLLQQLALPAAIAHASGDCGQTGRAGAMAAPTTPQPTGPASCCGSSKMTQATVNPGCGCGPSMCACNTPRQPEPAVPERNNRSADQLTLYVALPARIAFDFPQAERRALLPDAQAAPYRGQARIQAVLCIWRT